eukprot:jgi/Botrbrau1/19105/Bobra.0077s0019.1
MKLWQSLPLPPPRGEYAKICVLHLLRTDYHNIDSVFAEAVRAAKSCLPIISVGMQDNLPLPNIEQWANKICP